MIQECMHHLPNPIFSHLMTSLLQSIRYLVFFPFLSSHWYWELYRGVVQRDFGERVCEDDWLEWLSSHSFRAHPFAACDICSYRFMCSHLGSLKKTRSSSLAKWWRPKSSRRTRWVIWLDKWVIFRRFTSVCFHDIVRLCSLFILGINTIRFDDPRRKDISTHITRLSSLTFDTKDPLIRSTWHVEHDNMANFKTKRNLTDCILKTRSCTTEEE